MVRNENSKQVLYSLGIGMMVVGFFLFISIFFYLGSLIGSQAKFNLENIPVINVFSGLMLIAVGFILSKAGAKGIKEAPKAANPLKTDDNTKQWNVAGPGAGKTAETVEIIKIRCKSCGTLNDEDAEYCKKCGTKI